MLNSQNTAKSMAGFATYSAYTGVLVTVGLVIIGGGSMEMIWALINTLQLIAYLPLITPYFPKHVRTMFEILKFANGDFEFLSDLFNLLISFSMKGTKEFNEIFTKNGIDTTLLLDNSASLIMSLLLYTGLFISAILLSTFCCIARLKIFFAALVSSFLFNNFIKFLVEGYLELIFG